MARKCKKVQASVRATIKFDNTIISLMGVHGNEWSIIKTSNNTVVMTTYPNRTIARKEWNNITKHYKK